MFLSRNKKKKVYFCNPQFYYIKVGFKGVKIIQACLRDAITLPGDASKTARQEANSIDPDQMLYSVVSDLDLHYSLRPVCLNYLRYRIYHMYSDRKA